MEQAEEALSQMVAPKLANLRQMQQQYKATEPPAKALRKRFVLLIRPKQLIQQRLAELEQGEQAIQHPAGSDCMARRSDA